MPAFFWSQTIMERNENANGFEILTAHLQFIRQPKLVPKQAFHPGAEDHSGAGELHQEMLLKLYFVKYRKIEILSFPIHFIAVFICAKVD